METKEKKHTLAVLIARFQTHELTEAHKELIETALQKHPKVLILLGLSPTKGTINNPLDYQPRKQMLLESFPPKQYPNLSIGYVKDNVSDKKWSENVDSVIEDHLSVTDSAILYGGRDSFIPHYQGKFPVKELVSSRYISGTEIRQRLSQAPQSTPDFRAGAIWATFQRYPTVFATVDVAVYDPKEKRVLLARKLNEHNLRFVGGFVSPSDNSYEEAALRELYEETSLTVGLAGLRYIGSAKIDDWRYRKEQDKIITHLYLGLYSMGCARANDDIAEVVWISLDRLTEEKMVDEHKPLLKMVLNYINSQKL